MKNLKEAVVIIWHKGQPTGREIDEFLRTHHGMNYVIDSVYRHRTRGGNAIITDFGMDPNELALKLDDKRTSSGIKLSAYKTAPVHAFN